MSLSARTRTLRLGFSLAVPFFLLTALGVSAQLDQRAGSPQQANATALRRYEWKARTEILKGGETKKVRVTSMRYDAAGNLLQMPVSETPDENIPKHGLIGHIAQKKKKEFLEKVAALGTLARSYSEIPPQQMQLLMAGARLPVSDGPSRLLRIEGHNLVQSGDTMTVYLDPDSHKQRRVEIHTTLDQKPVRIVSEFQDLPENGPSYVARTSVNYAGDAIGIVTTNYDYRPSN